MKDKSNLYNILKFVLTILVVFAHSSRMYTGGGIIKPLNESQALCNITNLIYSFHMPLFIAVSGMVYGFCIEDLDKYHHTISFIKNKFYRLIIPYLFCGIVCVAPVMVAYKFTDLSYIYYCLNGIVLMGDTRHLWYLIVLFEIFMIMALIRSIILKRNIFFVFCIFFSFLLLSHYSFRFPSSFLLKECAYYILFFYLGYLFNRYYHLLKIFNPVFILIVIIILSFLTNNDDLHWTLRIFHSISRCIIPIIIVSFCPSKISNCKFISKANQNGFGIYLFHPMIIYVLYYYLGYKNINPFVLCILITIIAYIISLFLTELVRITHLSVFIGEKTKNIHNPIS